MEAIRIQVYRAGKPGWIEIPVKYIKGDFAVHRRINDIDADDRVIYSEEWWNVTHIPSGMNVMPMGLLRDARRVAGELAGFTVPYRKGKKWLDLLSAYIADNSIA